jgi:hypothetical protein
MLTMLNRSYYYRDNNKRGVILIDCGSHYMNPIRLTSKKGLSSMLAWIRRAKTSLEIRLNGNFYALWPDGKLRKTSYGSFAAAEPTEDITVGEYLSVLNRDGAFCRTYLFECYNKLLKQLTENK